MVFDITLSNNTWGGGTASYWEGPIGKKVFYHVHCHHTYELIVQGVHKEIFGEKKTHPSIGSDAAVNDFLFWKTSSSTKSFDAQVTGTD